MLVHIGPFTYETDKVDYYYDYVGELSNRRHIDIVFWGKNYITISGDDCVKLSEFLTKCKDYLDLSEAA